MKRASAISRILSSTILSWSTAVGLWAVTPSSGAAQQPQSQELIVLLAAGPNEPAPEDVVNRAEHGQSLPNALGVGGPTGANLLIPQQDRRSRPQDDPESPSARLLRYVVISYPLVVDLETIRKALQNNPHVLSVDYNRQFHVSAVPNDPLFPATDSSGNLRTPDQYQWGSAALHLPQAWDYNKGHAYVGVVDLGLDTTHPDLMAFHQANGVTVYDGGNFRPQFAFDYGYPSESPNSVDEGQPELENGQIRTPTNAGHGTHVSGIIAGTANNQTGVAGACWSCGLIISKVSTLVQLVGGGWGNAGTTQANVAAGMNGALTKGAQVLNMSLGYRSTDNPPPPNCQPGSTDSFCTALQLSQDRDVLVVAASGNDHSSVVDFPASDSRALAIGGIDSTGSLWNDCSTTSFECGSNYNPDQVVSPAKQILSTFYRGLYYQTGSNATCTGFTDYGLCTGTSMASPYMAASAGILRSVDPLLTKDNIKDLLRTHLDNPAGWNSQFGRGKPDVSTAVKAALGTSGGAQIPNRLTPLFSLYSSVAQDFFYTTVPQMAASAILDSASSYLPSGPAVPGYPKFPGTDCHVSPCPDSTPRASVYIFTGDKAPYAGAPPLVPLYRLSYKPNDPTSTDRDTTYTTDTAGVLTFKNLGYELDGIEGYIYQRCTPEPSCIPPGAVRLYRLYNHSRDDYAIFPESELAQFQAAGYVSQPGLNDWIGYVYPNVDSDGDGLIDGFELLIGTNPLVADSDCDGLSDGQEVLNYPYTDPLGPGCAGSPVWVSTKGDDGNSCSYSTPCRTFAGALSRIASGGEIDVLDSGDFGPLTINKSVSLISAGPLGGIQATTGNAITINAGANDKVVLRGLTLDGLSTGTTGVSFVSGGSLYVEGCTINNFLWGVDFAPTSGSGKLWITDSIVRNNGFASGGGVHLIATTGPGFVASIDRLQAEGNGAGVKAESQGTVTIRNSLSASNGWAGFTAYTPASGNVQMLVENSVSTHNGTIGVQSNGSGATVTLSNVVVTDNPTGLGIFNGGAILSFGNNRVQGNTTDGAPSQTIITH